MPNLYHEIRENGRTISAGNSDGGGYGVWMRRRIGSVLDIAVKDPKTGAMTTLSARIIVQKPNQSNAYIARVQAPCYKQTITLQPRQGTQGDYRRKTHTVKKGETLEGIAKQYSTTLQILHHLNKDKIKDPNKIQVGWVLKVPPKNSGLQDSDASAGTKTQTTKNTQANPYTKPKITTSNYQIEKGDTLGSIAQRSGKSISDLQRLNGITDPNKIQAGKYIKTGLPNTPKPAQPATKPSSQPVPTQASSTSGQSGGILDKVQEVFGDGMDWLDQKTQPIQDKFEQTIDYGSKIFNEGVDVVSQTAGKVKDDALDTVPGLFNDKPSQTQTPSQAPKPTEIKPVQTTEQNERSQEGGTPKVVVSTSSCSGCQELTLDELKQLFSQDSATVEKLKICVNAYNYASKAFMMNDCNQKAHFFAHVMQEIGEKFEINGENLNYSWEALYKGDFKAFRGNIELSRRYGRGGKPGQKANQEAIANIAYANRMGNGSVSSGDGWRYRGGGIIQVTGKDKYQKINDTIKKFLPNFNKIITPDNINNIEEGTIASMAYWVVFGVRDVAQKGNSIDIFHKTVDIVNKNTSSREKRVDKFKKCLRVFKVSSCNIIRPPAQAIAISESNAPWMEIAIREGRQWKGVKEGKITDNYHQIVGIPYPNLVGDIHQWCAAFINSCLKECGYTLPINEQKDIYERVRAHAYKRDKVNFQKISIPAYGAIAVTKKGSHVCFVLGRQNSKNFFRLGGNQGNMITVDTRSIDSYEYFLPMAYYKKNTDPSLAPIMTESDIRSRGLNFYETNSTT
ncbi:LysM peptidoglycan-binding domain-containing protein [Moraxella bovis]|uniref:LysM peptidoglycan-binding domain-containing protein n=1 Tax=Moraxella bovis TaxID=476 RepID=UPI002227338B|nr:LysM peptidoglycan-binding domain-containing protein [Moraxella bovis]UZA27785.1 LysM peptidoglycan-binding domain-containing protein [Moraxella bovis]